MGVLKFPKDFLWGASTSAHQVEGANHNDWTEWEKTQAKHLAGDAQRRFGKISPVWSEIEPEATDPANYISGQACDHYNRYEEDLDIAKQLGLTAYRFSIEWSRVEPRKGEFDESAIEHYRKMIQAVRQRGMEPFVTLWHWTIPIWVRDEGGWASRKTIDHYTHYVAKAVEELRDDVRFWVTTNEQESVAGEAFLLGHWPPQKRSLLAYLKVTHHLIDAHRAAYPIIKALDPDAQVGIVNGYVHFDSEHKRLVNRVLKNLADWWNYFYALGRIGSRVDFIGLNYYFHNRINYWFGRKAKRQTSDMGWELYPRGIYHVLKLLKRFRKPIYITEHGLADRQDRYRIWYVNQTLREVHRAISEGADVRGYFYWSLLDNFEWDKGFWPRFGLIEVDRKTQRRKLRPSALDYARIIKNNGVQSQAGSRGRFKLTESQSD
jgi:beta-glucosidase